MIKLTPKRSKVYQILSKSQKPMSAEEIYEKLDDTLNLSTIYRALDKFYQEGVASRNYLDNTAYYFLLGKTHQHFMICNVCKKQFEMDCHLEGLVEEIKTKHGFVVTHHDLNLYGTCQNCVREANA